ncbi:MAG: hypothetical protein PHI12_09750 [Dehalococcoidales bacterium]|nr:hypothetical protein [Dehalococcoidales bacterium]
MSKIVCSAISGLSDGVSGKEFELRKFLRAVFAEVPETKIEKLRCVPSVFSRQIEGSVDFLEEYKDETVYFLLVGKSFGAIRTWWMLHEYWDRINRILNRGHKIGVVLVDPHGWAVGDGTVGSYGIHHMELPWYEEWGRSRLCFRCIYQRNEYPRGASLAAPESIVGAINVQLEGDADHYNVIDIETETGREVAEYVKGMLNWLDPYRS